MTTINDSQKVYQWGEDLYREEINTDSVPQTIDWIAKFCGNYRLPNDVGLPLERCVVGSYQIGYLFDYFEKDPSLRKWEDNAELSNKEEERESEAFKSYWEEGIASVLIHIIASYQMTDRDSYLLFSKTYKEFTSWNRMVEGYEVRQPCLYFLSQATFKYQRWMLYNHMKRTKRWNENEFNSCYIDVITNCLGMCLFTRSKLSRGFALAMSKLQDGEIKRH